MTKVTKISIETTVNEYNELIFPQNNRVMRIEESDVDFMSLFGYNEYIEDERGTWSGTNCDVFAFSECSPAQIQIIIDNVEAYDITEQYLEEQAKILTTKRKSFLSNLMSNAWSKVKAGVVLSMRAALYNAWTEAKAVAWTVVTFYKLKTDEVKTREVRFIEVKKNGTFLFLDLEKDSLISFHPKQLISFS